MELIADSANSLFAQACAAVRNSGVAVSPRGMETRELLGAHLVLTNPRRRFVDLPPARFLNPAFAVAEALWILSGSDAPWIFRFNRNLEKYADGGMLRGAYGPRLRRWAGGVDQLERVRKTLSADPDSRRAVIQLFNPECDDGTAKDVPCTLSWRFYLRGGLLHLHSTMRSQDVWLGLPYDMFAATLLHELMAGWLGVELGIYRHSVDSLHLYAANLDAAAAVPQEAPDSFAMKPFAIPWDAADPQFARVIEGRADVWDGPPWTGWSNLLASYGARRDGDSDSARLFASAPDTGALGEALLRWYDALDAARSQRRLVEGAQG